MIRLRVAALHAGVLAALMTTNAGLSLAGEPSSGPRPAEKRITGTRTTERLAPIITAQVEGPAAPRSTPPPPKGQEQLGSTSVEDLLLEKGSITMDDWIRIKAEEEYKLAEREKRTDMLEEWKSKLENMPILTDKVNFGLNALQWLYTHQDAHVREGQSQDGISIRRSEFLFWGKINEYIPRWHALYEFQSINLTSNTPGCAAGTDCTNRTANPLGTATAATFFRESYIDFRPVIGLAPNLNFIRLGIFRMPFGIFTETSGGLRDIISSPYLTSVGSGAANSPNVRNGTAGQIEFIHERDFFIDVRGRLFNRLEYVAGMMNNNNFQANVNNFGAGVNAPKVFYTRERFFITDVSFVSFTLLTGGSNNTNTFINGRGKGEFNRLAVDFRYTSKLLPGLMIQGEWWTGHDGPNQTTVGLPAQGACLTQTVCGGNGAPGVERQTWYLYGKYLFTNGLLENWEPVVYYEQFDPNTSIGNDLYYRTVLGLNYYFENLPPKIQTKLMFDYEFRHHSGFGPGNAPNPTVGVGDPFAQNAFYIQFQVRYM
jgi:hypothetical protein